MPDRIDSILAELDELEFSELDAAPEPLTMPERQTRRVFSQKKTAAAMVKRAAKSLSNK